MDLSDLESEYSSDEELNTDPLSKAMSDFAEAKSGSEDEEDEDENVDIPKELHQLATLKTPKSGSPFPDEPKKLKVPVVPVSTKPKLVIVKDDK